MKKYGYTPKKYNCDSIIHDTFSKHQRIKVVIHLQVMEDSKNSHCTSVEGKRGGKRGVKKRGKRRGKRGGKRGGKREERGEERGEERKEERKEG